MIEARDLTFGYRRDQPVLRDATLSLAPGAVTVIAGPNGAGKSTLLRLLLGLRKPWSGSATIDGKPADAIKARDRARRVAYIPQRPSIAGPYTVRQVVRLGRFAVGADERIVDAALRALDLADRADELAAELSVGQRQRVALARAMAQLGWGDPDNGDARGRAILADEPTSAMDPKHALRTMDRLREAARAGVAVGVVLHDLTAARRWADRAILMDSHGCVAAAGEPDEALSPKRLEAVFGVAFRLAEAPGAGAAVLALPDDR